MNIENKKNLLAALAAIVALTVSTVFETIMRIVRKKSLLINDLYSIMKMQN